MSEDSNKYKRQAKYAKRTGYAKTKESLARTTVQFTMRLSYASDSDVISYISSMDNKNDYFRKIVRADMEKHQGSTVRHGRIIPLIGTAFAAGPAEPESDVQLGTYTVPENSKADFAIRITGNSMEPYLPDESIQLCVKKLPENGEVGVFVLNGEFLVKQCCIDVVGNLYLFSLNRNCASSDRAVYASGDERVLPLGTVILPKKYPLPSSLGER